MFFVFLVQHFSEMGERKKKKKKGTKRVSAKRNNLIFFSDGGMIDWLSE